jgi:hypothetical protein
MYNRNLKPIILELLDKGMFKLASYAGDKFDYGILDGHVKSPIYVVVGLKRQFAVPYVLPNHRFRHQVHGII